MSKQRSVEDREFLAQVCDGVPRSRDERGWYLPGHTLGGRPKGFDFRAIVTKFAAERGEPVEEALARVYESLLRTATGGDVTAAKLLIERLCGKEVDVVDIDMAVSKHHMSDTERAARIAAILHAGGWRRATPGDGSA